MPSSGSWGAGRGGMSAASSVEWTESGDKSSEGGARFREVRYTVSRVEAGPSGGGRAEGFVSA